MLLEDLVCDLHKPLITLKFINDVLYEKIEGEWSFFAGETREQAEYLFAMLLINKHIIRYLFMLRQRYGSAVGEIYKIKP